MNPDYSKIVALLRQNNPTEIMDSRLISGPYGHYFVGHSPAPRGYRQCYTVYQYLPDIHRLDICNSPMGYTSTKSALESAAGFASGEFVPFDVIHGA